MKNEFGTSLISQYDYSNDALQRRDSMTSSGPAFEDVEPNPLAELTATYTSNELNQYDSIQSSGDSMQLSYDLDGNLTQDDAFEYDYDAENRLIAVTPLFPLRHPYKLEFEYDYKSRRVGKQVYEWLQADNWLLDSATTFVYDGWNLIKESITVNGETSRNSYVWGLDLSGTLQGAGGIGGLLMRNTDSGDYLYLYDANGNVGQLVDAADGNIAARYEYDPFGNLLAATGPEAEKNPFRFSTKYFDAETGLYYYLFRYYSIKLGRWINRDLLEEYGGKNLYGFVKNNPIDRFDPFGLLSDESEALLKQLPAINANSSVTEITSVIRTLIAVARKERHHIAADNLNHYLTGNGQRRELPVDWLRSFTLVKNAERTNQKRFEKDLKKIAKKMKEGETKRHSDHWDRLISYGGMGSSDEELFWASGDSTLSSYGGFILKRNSCEEVEVEGMVIHTWRDDYDFHKNLGVFIPGYGRIPDEALLKLKTEGSAKEFTMGAEWRQYLSGKITLWLKGIIATTEWEWSGP